MSKAAPLLLREFKAAPWQLFGGDEWFTHEEADAILRAADQLVKDSKKAADKAKQPRARRSVPHRRRR